MFEKLAKMVSYSIIKNGKNVEDIKNETLKAKVKEELAAIEAKKKR